MRIIDFITFPIRALLLPERDRWGLTSWKTERYNYVAYEVGNRKQTLDIGCGKNEFVRKHLSGQGHGVDIHLHEGLTEDNIVKGNYLPLQWKNNYDCVTFIASMNHMKGPRGITCEAFRVLRPGGKIVVTMGNPIAEVLAHWVIGIHIKLGKGYDLDGHNGSNHRPYMWDWEIKTLLLNAGFKDIKKKYFWTQWGFNHLFTAVKEDR